MKALFKKVLKFILKSKYGTVKSYCYLFENNIHKATSRIYRNYQQKKSVNQRNDLNSSPLVSVIMTVYNRERFISESINSILTQSYDNLELIIINDGSTDGSEKIIKSFNDSRIRYQFKNNTGQQDTFFEASKLVAGLYVTRVDSDDYIDKDYIKKFVSQMQSGNLDFCYCKFYEIDEFSRITKIRHYKYFKDYKELVRGVFYTGYTLIPDVGFWTKGYFEKYVIKNYIINNIPYYIDNVKTAKFFCINEPLYFYRIHNQNYASNINNIKIVLSGMLQTLIFIYKNYAYDEFLKIRLFSDAKAKVEIARVFYNIGLGLVDGQIGNAWFNINDNLFRPFFIEAKKNLETVPRNNRYVKKLCHKIDNFLHD